MVTADEFDVVSDHLKRIALDTMPSTRRADTGGARHDRMLTTLCALVTHTRKVVHDVDAAVNRSRIGEHVSNQGNQQQDNGNAMVITPRQEYMQRVRDEMAPGEKPGPIVPRTFLEVITMCQAMAAADLAPKHLRGKPTDMAMVIMTGAEVGLPPMASLRLYTTWDGVPRLMAEGMRAIIIAHPDCEWFRRVRGSESEAVWSTKRRGQPEQTCTWTIERAKRAGLLSKDTWQKYPEDLLTARCSMQLARIEWPDVVAGMLSKEEAQDGDFIDVQGTEAKPQFVAPPPPQGVPPGMPLAQEIRAAAAQQAVTVTTTGTPPSEQPRRTTRAAPKDKSTPSQTPGTDPFRAAREAVDQREAARPTTPASAQTPSPQPSASTSTAAAGSTSEAAPAVSSPTTDRWGQPIADPTSGDGGSAATAPAGNSTASETPSTASTNTTSSDTGAAIGASPDDGFGGEDPVDSQPVPTGDPGLALIADLKVFLASCKTQTEMANGRPPFAQRCGELFKGGDKRFAAPSNGQAAGELAIQMGQLWAERKTQVPV